MQLPPGMNLSKIDIAVYIPHPDDSNAVTPSMDMTSLLVRHNSDTSNGTDTYSTDTPTHRSSNNSNHSTPNNSSCGHPVGTLSKVSEDESDFNPNLAESIDTADLNSPELILEANPPPGGSVGSVGSGGSGGGVGGVDVDALLSGLSLGQDSAYSAIFASSNAAAAGIKSGESMDSFSQSTDPDEHQSRDRDSRDTRDPNPHPVPHREHKFQGQGLGQGQGQG
mmetsp:Transcript_19301/g.43608  ORF Transcript_19301/g.43608 Transcript_19301/m.43608 type:complete len:223 (-) Transcript_19301:78-746(-)